MLYADLTIEVAYHFQSTLIEGERHHLEVWATELRLQPIQGWHFLPAGHAPGGPEVQQQHLAAKVGQAAHFPPGIDELEFRHRLWLWPYGQAASHNWLRPIGYTHTKEGCGQERDQPGSPTPLCMRTAHVEPLLETISGAFHCTPHSLISTRTTSSAVPASAPW
ncbi:hypothetical protein D3C85_1088530 [compost metagenome]